MTDRSSALSILVVDDSEGFLTAACSWIETQPRLRLQATARNGLEALKTIDRESPDLVLMDAFMPILDGFEATRRIKTEPDAPLVVMLSVHEGSAVEKEAWAAGADAFVSKSEFAGRLPEVIRTLTSEDGGKPGGRTRDRGRKAVRPEAASRNATPEDPAQRSAGTPGPFTRLLRGVRARLDKVGNNRRPAVVSARSLTEGGIS